MLHKHGKRLLGIAARPSVLGSGLLERARSTTLALLGVTAAFGLGTVAVALNQSWPLVADSPIPAAPSLEQGVGKAKVASGAVRDRRDTGSTNRRRRTGTRAEASPSPAGPEAAPVDPGPTGELVVSPAAAAEPRQGRPSGAAGDRGPAPAAAKPQAPPAAPTPSPPPQPPPAAAPASGVAETPAPTATTSAVAAEESNVPAWSNGKGHAYGRSDDKPDE